jgi:DNA-binding CsgD family transcriptional regulator
MLGYSIQELLTCSIKDLTHPDDMQRETRIIKEMVQNKLPFAQFEKRYVKKDGTFFWAELITSSHWDENERFKFGLGIIVDITLKKKFFDIENARKQELEREVEKRTHELNNMNTALQVLLDKRRQDQDSMEKTILENYERTLLPIFRKLQNITVKPEQKFLIETLHSSVKQMIIPYEKKFSDPMKKLTPREIQISLMVKEGLSNKEIANSLNKSLRTITTHRENIRKKLSLKNKKINLRTHLLSLSDT